jgi:putative hydrolase of the HAD superfamily
MAGLTLQPDDGEGGGAMGVSAVVFDYGGVLCRRQPGPALATMEALAGVPGERLWPAYWDQREPYDRGQVDGPGFWAAVGRELGIDWSSDTDKLAALTETDTLSWTDLEPHMIEWAAELSRTGVRTALLSNAPPELRDHLLAEFEWLERFDVTTFSCDLGLVKPEAAIYQACVEELGVAPGDALFLDDRQPNVDGALRAGLRAMVFTNPDTLADGLGDHGLPVPTLAP